MSHETISPVIPAEAGIQQNQIYEKDRSKNHSNRKTARPDYFFSGYYCCAQKKIIAEKSSLIELDFSDVEFISRSTAHELILMKEDLQNKKEITIANANEAVIQMLRIVAANRIAPKTQKPKFNPKRVDIKFLYNKFSV